MPQTEVKPYQKALNKIAKTNEALASEHDYIKEDRLKNKLYKQYKELADQMVGSVQYRINHRGAYENAGQSEINEFINLASMENFNYQQFCNLKDYINRKVDNLKY